jgi:cysteinyl-tRNA synthetase
MNVTDVGHLTSDADEGEDKMEKAARKEGKKAKDIANFYLKIFKEDFKKLNITEPDVWCKATDYIKEQISMIKLLEKKGFTYVTDDGVYFDSTKIKDYGKLALLKLEGLQEGKRTEVREKKNKTDFALWKFSEEKGKRQQEWESKFGLGFPGWHIECSAMSSKHLGKQFDIHTGGEDHIPVHHTNEIAQSEAAFDKKPWVNYWLHGSFLVFKGKKVSKSKGGLYTIDELEKQGYNSLVYRYFVLGAHYRTQLEFSLDNLEGSKNSLNRLRNLIMDLKDDKEINKKYLGKFEKMINDDLNMPKAIAVLWELVRDEKAKGKLRTIKEMDKVFGLDLLKKEEDISKEIKELIDKREKFREEKNWEKSDEIRDKLNEKGIILEDSEKGVKWRRKGF